MAVWERIVFLYLVLFVAVISLSEAISCKGPARYKLVFQAEWTAQSHPQDFPSGNNPHFSSLVGCSHNASYVMWKPGMNASLGVKDVAERGINGELNKEMDKQINLKAALKRFQVGGINSGSGSTTVKEIQVNSHYPLVSAISMIAPSPDWFVGVHDYSLCNESTAMWVEKIVKDLPLYDSGTDSALTFVHSNTATTPPVPIFLITNNTEGSLKSNHTLKRFGTFTFERIYDAVPTSSFTFISKSTSTITVPPTQKPVSSTPTSGGNSFGYLNASVFLKMIASLFVMFAL